MPEQKKPLRDAVDRVLDFATDHVKSRQDAEQDLRKEGVDVDGFVAVLRQRAKEKRDATRLAALNRAREGVARVRTSRTRLPTQRFADMDRAALWSEIQRRGLAQAHFNRLEETTDDDLRSWLEDAQALDEDE